MTQAEVDIRASGSLQEGKSMIKFVSDDSERFYVFWVLWQGLYSSLLHSFILQSFPVIHRMPFRILERVLPNQVEISIYCVP